MALAIVFRPKDYGINGSFGFYYQINRTPALRKVADKGAPVATLANEPIEIDMVELKPGVNFVEPAVWDQVVKHGQNGQIIATMQSKAALSIHVPDTENPVGATSDFSSVAVVEDILRHITDEDWVSYSMNNDKRQDVFKRCSERLKQIRDKEYDRPLEFA